MSEKQTGIGVVGGGLMGVGIATRFALAGYPVTVIETSPERAAQVPAIVSGIVGELEEAGIAGVDDRARAIDGVRVESDLGALAGLGLVIEAIPEILEAKQALYERLEGVLAADAIVASNTSGFPPDVLAGRMAHSERFLIAHFWNPPHVIPLVEVVPGKATVPDAVEQLRRLLAEVGAEPVVLKAAIPGFIGNRLQFAILREALNIVRSGAATPEQVDQVMKASLGRRYGITGPLEVADLGGLGTFLAISTHLMPELAKDEGVLDVLRAHVEKGELGAATGQGFYRWDQARLERVRALRRRQLAGGDAADRGEA